MYIYSYIKFKLNCWRLYYRLGGIGVDFAETSEEIIFSQWQKKDFTFISISVKCILWQISNDIVENKDLYRNRNDFKKKFGSNNTFFLI